MNGPPEAYSSASVVTVQCPRCGHENDIRLVTRVAGGLEFAAVCSTPIVGGGLCSTTLQLLATAHVFPAA